MPIIRFKSHDIATVRAKWAAAKLLFGDEETHGEVKLGVSADPLDTNRGDCWCAGRPQPVKRLGRKLAHIPADEPGKLESFDPSAQSGPVTWHIQIHAIELGAF